MKLEGEQFSRPTYYIDSEGDFQRALEQLKMSRILGVDTESNSLHAYNEQVCFVQISNPRANYIFDPLRLEDISGLGELFADPKIEKIFHGADYDVGLLKRDFNFTFSNLFDTMTAAQYLNMEKIGLGDLVEMRYEIHLEKKYTKCDWAQRPVSIEKMEYLCQDTQYLIGLREWLYTMMVEKDLTEEAALEFEFLEHRAPLDPAYSNQSMWDIKGARALDPGALPGLSELFRWRRRQAKRQNTPPFKVLNNKTMLDIACENPKNKKQLMDIKGITLTVWRRHGQDILAALEKARKLPPDWKEPKPPVKKKNSGRRAIHFDDQELAEALKKWRQEKAAKTGIHALAVLPGHVLSDITRLKPVNEDGLASIPWLGDKRISKYGHEIIDIVKENS